VIGHPGRNLGHRAGLAYFFSDSRVFARVNFWYENFSSWVKEIFDVLTLL
jgi:hypothetical protein